MLSHVTQIIVAVICCMECREENIKSRKMEIAEEGLVKLTTSFSLKWLSSPAKASIRQCLKSSHSRHHINLLIMRSSTGLPFLQLDP